MFVYEDGEREKFRRFQKRIDAVIIAMLLITLASIAIITINFNAKLMMLEQTEASTQELITEIRLCQCEEEAEEVVTLDEAERDLIERVVMAEAGNEPYEGLIAVANVIKDRGDLWNMSYTDVVLAKGQFTAPYQDEVTDAVKKAVTEVFDYNARAFEEPVTHFYAWQVIDAPNWTYNKMYRGRIGGHDFYY